MTVSQVAWIIVAVVFVVGFVALTAADRRGEFPGRRQGGGTHNTEQGQ